MRSVPIICLLLAIAQNAFASFNDLEIKTSLSGDYVLGVMVSDQRETVSKWGAAENLIGAHHSGMFKNRKDLLTSTQGTVTTELTEGLRKQFALKWLSVAPLSSTAKDSPEVLVGKIRQAKLHRTFLITLKTLWVEAQPSNQTAITYGFVISILDDKGTELAKTDLEGLQTTNQWGYWGATEIFGMLISGALENKKIIDALTK